MNDIHEASQRVSEMADEFRRQDAESRRGDWPMDYEVLHECTYPVPRSGGVYVDPHGDCGNPATHRVWWRGNDDMLVCQDHFEFIRKKEAECA